MNRFGVVLILLITIVVFTGGVRSKGVEGKNKKVTPTNRQHELSPTIVPTQKIHAVRSKGSIFVPYWSLTEGITDHEYDEYLYFSVGATTKGIIKADIKSQESGYWTLESFISKRPQNKPSYMTLGLHNSEENFKILADKSAQKRIVADTIELLNKYDLTGVAIDLELTALPLSEVKNQISVFMKLFATSLHKNKKRFYIVVYGDTFYRLRPYDVAFFSQYADKIMVMAYDFHKSHGEPGPNFPLNGREQFGYDFQTMVEDFLKVVPSDKLNIIFGMFGYDWTLGPQGLPLKQAQPIALKRAIKQFSLNCQEKKCVVRRDEKSMETQVRYEDEEGFMHEVWFEDEESVEAKKRFLEEKGIGSYSLWGYGYF